MRRPKKDNKAFSSKFAEGNRWGYFPSAAAAWRVSEEGFWKDNAIGNVVNNFKLRVGYGTTGNCNIDNYMYATAYNATVYPVGNQETAALAPGSTVGNNNLKWDSHFHKQIIALIVIPVQCQVNSVSPQTQVQSDIRRNGFLPF